MTDPLQALSDSSQEIAALIDTAGYGLSPHEALGLAIDAAALEVDPISGLPITPAMIAAREAEAAAAVEAEAAAARAVEAEAQARAEAQAALEAQEIAAAAAAEQAQFDAEDAFVRAFGDGSYERGLRRLVRLGQVAATGPVDAGLFGSIRMGA